ncbi:A24 family peptidase [Amycolatopsis acidiphila]|uniref:Prepilin peptidase n=2 Tax=Amycolatopsis acidiphila TaxID=715473 RepID=A0A557ZUI3_9PSEU|nr:prepilin peptidase [Amycolatopsis acidiphila]UIJ63920.1 A24 family peptidase [Amycolatopsis acidiphila]
MAGATLAVLASAVLARARAPAPVPLAPVAAMTAALWAVVGWRWLGHGWPSWWLPVPLALTTFAVPLAAADLRHRRLPDVLTLPAYPILAIALCASATTGPGIGLAVRALAAGAVFGGLHLLVHALSRSSLGAGDVKLAGALGAVLGAVSWAALVVAAVLAAMTTVVLALTRRRRHGVPHGPGLLLATWLVAVFHGTGTGA